MIPNDDIFDFYSDADEYERVAISDILSKRDFISATMDDSGNANIGVRCNPDSSTMMVFNIMVAMRNEFGRIWLENFVKNILVKIP